MPTIYIEPGYEIIKSATITPSETEIDQPLTEALQKFYNYFETNWLHRFESGEYSWHRSIQSTNNPIEAMHHIINSMISKNPDSSSLMREYNINIHIKLYIFICMLYFSCIILYTFSLKSINKYSMFISIMLNCIRLTINNFKRKKNLLL